jgi:hypothetical protein
MQIELKDKTGIKGKFQITKTCALTGDVLYQSEWQDNLVMNGTDTGLNLVLDKLNSDNTYSLNISHLDIGTSTTAPATSQTNLIAGVARTAKASGTVSGSTLTLGFFFASADLANGTYREIGTFIDGSSTLGTGQLFSRALFASNYTKGTNQNTTVSYVYQIS